MAKVTRQFYYQFLKDEKKTLFTRLMHASHALEKLSSPLVGWHHLTPKGVLKIHKKVLGGLLYELKELDKIHHEIVNRGGGCIVEIKRYK